MIAEIEEDKKPWQKKGWVQWLAIILGVLPSYVIPIYANLRREQALSMVDLLFYTIVFGGSMTIGMALLLRFLCGERFRDLNRKGGRWWKDILGGIGLSILTLAVAAFLSGAVDNLFPGESDRGLDFALKEMIQNWWMFALMMGPGLIIGAALFEEFTRVFLLTRLWNISSNKAWKWLTVLFSAVIFGLAHIYQGTAGMILTGIFGLMMAIVYLISGRIVILMMAHYLYNAIQFALIYFSGTTPG